MIPKKIHYCWLSGEKIPEILQKSMATWKKILPDYEFVLWDANRFDINSVRWVKEAFEAKKYAFAADYIRFYALYGYGGIYLDCDVEVLKTFNNLLESKSFMGFEYISIPEAAVIGAEAGLTWIKKCLEYYTDKSFYDEKGKIKDVAVPIMVKTILRRHFNQKIADTSQIQHLGDLDLYPYQYFSPRNPYKNRVDINDNTYCIHHSVGSWNGGGKHSGGGRSKINRYKHLLLSGILRKERYDELLYRHHLKKIKKEMER